MGDPVIKTVKPSGGDYTSLTNWEAGRQADLTSASPEFAEVYGGTTETALTINGWTTTATNYIKIYAAASDRHAGVWNDAKAKIVIADDAAISVSEEYVVCDGMQIGLASPTASRNILVSNVGATSSVVISNCIIKGAASDTYAVNGILCGGGNLNIYNCIVYGLGNNGNTYHIRRTGGTVTIYNSTSVGGANTQGFYGDFTAVNCYSKASTGYAYKGTTISLTTCASADTTGTVGLQSIAANTTNFTNVTVGGEDFHIPFGSALIGVGTDGPFSAPFNYTTDIDGQTRASVWDIGADEYVAGGGTQYPLSLTGALEPSGAITRQSTKLFAGSLQPTGTPIKDISKFYAGSLEPTGLLSTLKATLLNIAGTLEPVGTFIKQTGKQFAGALQPAGAIAKQVDRAFTGTADLAGNAVKEIGKAFTGSLAPVGTIAKQIERFLAGTLDLAGDIAKSIGIYQTGSVAPAGGVVKTTTKILGGVITMQSARSPLTGTTYNLSLFGVISLHSARGAPTGATYNISFTGALAPLGALIKDTYKSLAGSITPTSTGYSLIKNYLLNVTGSIASGGSFVKSIGKSLAGVLIPVGDLITSGVGRVFQLAVTGIIQPAGSLVREISKSLSGTVTPVKTFARSISLTRYFTGDVTPSGDVTTLRAILLMLSGLIQPSGELAKSIVRFFSGSITATGALAKSIWKWLVGLLTPAGGFQQPPKLGPLLGLCTVSLDDRYVTRSLDDTYKTLSLDDRYSTREIQ